MRELSELPDKKSAAKFCGYLAAHGIDCRAEKSTDGKWMVWVLDDDLMAKAREELVEYLADPNDPRYAEGLKKALNEEQKSKRVRTREKNVDVRTTWGRGEELSFGFLTIGLFVLSGGASYLIHFVPDVGEQFMDLFFIDKTESREFLGAVRSGQVWRLVTPIFLHFGILHFVFNMMWLNLFGNMIEKKDGSMVFLAMVLTFSILPNLVQYMTSGPGFGGMSGVNYGLFGYIWIRSRYDPSSEMSLDKGTVVILLAWFVLCFTGLLAMPIANAAHAGGLIAGVTWGAVKVRRIPFTSVRF